MTKARLERFLDKFEADARGCWRWLRAKSVKGYGIFWDGTRQVRAHRAAYEHFVGPIPTGMVIDHLCNNPSCVNPGHMKVTTNRENILRGSSPTAQNARKRRCDNGHLFAGDNLYTAPSGRRGCRICRRMWGRRRCQKKHSPRAARAAGLNLF